MKRLPWIWYPCLFFKKLGRDKAILRTETGWHENHLTNNYEKDWGCCSLTGLYSRCYWLKLDIVMPATNELFDPRLHAIDLSPTDIEWSGHKRMCKSAPLIKLYIPVVTFTSQRCLGQELQLMCSFNSVLEVGKDCCMQSRVTKW